MTDRPILFSAPMVRALLAGAKTQTRRVLKTQPDHIVEGQIPHQLRIAVGDLLWVRESWSGAHQFRDTPPAQRESYATPDGPVLREDVWFWADGNPTGGDYEKPRPGIHMPRWASRLTLTVTDVRVERLQDISDRGQPNDCIAEGMFSSDFLCTAGDWMVRGFSSIEKCRYHDLWNEINGAGAWEAKPWVVAYTFTVHRGNIDQMAKEAA